MLFIKLLRVRGKLLVDPLVATDGANGLALAAPGLACRMGGAIIPEISVLGSYPPLD